RWVWAGVFLWVMGVAGAFSAVTSAEMMLDQSVPEPMPAKVRVGVVVTEGPPQKTKRRRRGRLRQRRGLRLAAAEQRERGAGQLVGLGENRHTGLLEDLVPGHRRGLGSDVDVGDTGLGVLQVLRGRRQVVDRDLQ